MKKKILFISPGCAPITGKKAGAIESLMSLYFSHNELTQKYDITVYSAYSKSDNPDKDTYKTIHVRNIEITQNSGVKRKIDRLLQITLGRPCARDFVTKIISDLKSRNEENYYDLIVFENSDRDIVWFKKHLATKTPIALHLHNDYLYKHRKDSKQVMDSLTSVWGVSEFICNRVKGIKSPNTKVEVAYNAINLDLFDKKASEAEKKKLKRSLSINDDDFVILYVGRIMPEKGVLELVRAYVKLKKQTPRTKLLIVGASKYYPKNDLYTKTIQHIASKHKSIILAGRIERQELYKYYQIANCQVIPSKWNEAFGLIALEGLTNNLRVISSQKGGLPEVFIGYEDKVKFLKKISPSEICKNIKLAMKETNIITQTKNDKFSENNYLKTIDDLIEENSL